MRTIAGSSADDGTGELEVTGTATLDGELVVSVDPGYTPTAADAYPLMRYGSRSGTFATETGSGGVLTTSYTPEQLVLGSGDGAGGGQNGGNDEGGGNAGSGDGQNGSGGGEAGSGN